MSPLWRAKPKAMLKKIAVIVTLLVIVLLSSAAEPVPPAKMPRGARVYVAPMGGFENYIIAGITNKNVPVVVVTDRDKAEYEIRGSAETQQASWAKMLFLGSQNTNEQASINVQEIKSGTIIFAYSVNKMNSVRGKQSAGEAIGKHLNEVIEREKSTGEQK